VEAAPALKWLAYGAWPDRLFAPSISIQAAAHYFGRRRKGKWPDSLIALLFRG
jgi:soluble lytic murein transglycosylase-like protein